MAKKKTKKPKKPYAAFPLYAHAGGVWAKKIRGKVRYFGPWDDWQGALESYKSQCDYLHLGKTPPPKEHTVANLLDLFLSQKQTQLNTGDIAESTFKEYEATCVVIDSHFGKHRPVDSLTIEDFNSLRVTLSKGTRKATLSPVTLKRRLTIARMVFDGQPPALLKGLKSPSQKVLRGERRKKGEPQVFNGRSWDRFVVGREFEKLCKTCKVTSHGFYSLRRTFETIATTAEVSQAIIDGIMGHAGNDMASVYRQKLFDQQLKKCTDHVREWYLGNLVIH